MGFGKEFIRVLRTITRIITRTFAILSLRIENENIKIIGVLILFAKNYD